MRNRSVRSAGPPPKETFDGFFYCNTKRKYSTSVVSPASTSVLKRLQRPGPGQACGSAFALPLLEALLRSCTFPLETRVAFLPFGFERLVLLVSFEFLFPRPKCILSATFLCTKGFSCWLRFLPKHSLSIFGLLPPSSSLAYWRSSFASVGSFISSCTLRWEVSFPPFGTRKHV